VRPSPRSGRGLIARVAAACLLALVAARPAAAMSAAEIRNQARQISGASGDAASEQHRIEQLGPLVLDFIDQCDDAARGGADLRKRDDLRGAFEALYGPLNGIYQARSSKLESMSRAIMDQDGDLEALYETKDFRESQAVAAAALYYLNWLDYYGARLYDGPRRKELFEAAESGFSQFAVGDQKGELITESQLGRGLCYLELGDTDSAVRDFKLVIDDANVSPERKAKARMAMLDAYSRSGSIPETLRYSDELLRGGMLPAADLPIVRFYRLKALFDGIDKKGPDAARYRQEASSLMETLRHAGKGWADRVDALMVSRIDDPSQWAGKAESPRVQWELARMMLVKNDYNGATPLLMQLVSSSDAEAKEFQPEAHYWIGVGRFKGGEFPAAADEFDAALASPGDWAKEARYLRFKALEAQMAKEATLPLAQRYSAALTEFVNQGADHPMIAEGRYRLGEYKQANSQYQAAIEEYEKVSGDPSYELRARFGTLQSRFELLKTDADPAARKARLDAIGKDLDLLSAEVKAYKATQKGGGDVELPELEAKATLLQAVYLSLQGDGGDEKTALLLADFGQRFPQQQDLVPQAARLRLGALLQLAKFSEAEQTVQQNADALAKEKRADAIEGLAVGYAKAGARRKGQGDAEGAASASRVALALYQVLDGDGAGGNAKKQLAVARIQESIGNWEAAATIYRAVLQQDGNSLLALRGLAQAEAQQGKTADALAHWTQYTEKSRPGDLGWFHGQYEQAQLLLAGGDRQKSCELLTKLRPSMPGLTDVELRNQFNDLNKRACG
jgi:tetratricopeptide (TPR) repeat protein